ncbi:MAG: ion transporter [Deltaproteobacteria bacterium]|nr:ion transporter [Deltaproteobacteria bacterium]
MKLKRIIEKTDTATGRAFDLFIQSLIILSLVCFSIETFPDLSKSTVSALKLIELITVLIFTVEYLLRLFVAGRRLKFIFSFYGVIDLVAVAPFYIASGIDLRSIRIFRLFRLLRTFKIFRYGKAAERFAKAFAKIKEELVLFFVATIFLLFFSSVGIYYFENSAQPEEFKSVFHCLWWAVATLTTVGYGDVYPITVGGKIFTSFIVVIGLGVVAVPAGLLASALTGTAKDDD